jgi:hypothetical protein
MDAQSIAGIQAHLKHRTSRLIKPQPFLCNEARVQFYAKWPYPDRLNQSHREYYSEDDFIQALLAACPYSVGETVAITERFTPWADEETKQAARESMFGDDCLPVGPVIYAADFVKGCPPLDVGGCERWLPPFLMRAEQARFCARITSIDVGRVQNLSYNDIVAEGYLPPPDLWWTLTADELRAKLTAAEGWWQRRWDGINAKRGYPYSADPWVYGYGFEVLEVKK